MEYKVIKNYPDFTKQGDPNCSQYDTEMFFPDPESSMFYYLLKTAKSICSNCPYQMACLNYAVENSEPGVWGGTSEAERKLMRRRGVVELPTPKVRKIWR